MEEPGIKIIDSFLNEPEKLFQYLTDNVRWEERMKARKTASFGVSYDYSGITYEQTKIPEVLLPICKNVEKEIGFLPNNILLNYYPDGSSSMGYHSDSSEELLPETGVVIISVGSEREISYKNKYDKDLVVKYLLKAGALLYMDNEVQEKWLHAIPKKNGIGPRISLTFRHIIK